MTAQGLDQIIGELQIIGYEVDDLVIGRNGNTAQFSVFDGVNELDVYLAKNGGTWDNNLGAFAVTASDIGVDVAWIVEFSNYSVAEPYFLPNTAEIIGMAYTGDFFGANDFVESIPGVANSDIIINDLLYA